MPREGSNAFARAYADRWYLDRANRDTYLSRYAATYVGFSGAKLVSPYINEDAAMDVLATNLNLVDDADFLAVLLNRGNPLWLPPFSEWTETNVGTGGTTPNGTYALQVCGATANSSTLLVISLAGLQPGALLNMTRVNYDKKLYIMFKCWREAAFATGVARIQFKDVNTIGQLAEKGMGIQISNFTLVGESYGTGRDVTATLATMTSRRTYRLLIVLDPAVNIKWYLDGVLVATQTTAAQIPTGEGGATFTATMSLAAGDPSVAAAEFGMTRPFIWQAV